MKNYANIVHRILIVAILSLPWQVAEALEKFTDAGAINNLSYDSFNIGDQKYRVTPSVKIKIPSTRNAKLSGLKVGDNVFVKGIVLSGIYYADLIIYHRIDNE